MKVISVEGLGKLYDLGQVGTGTISKDLNRWWARMRGKDDPYAKLGHTNDRTQRASKDESVWAIRDINFSVNKGEVVGIIGRNGAGKSTLLKIISRITAPTTGAVKVRGRIASLLEVGTGFHPEMTGRENIFMNGTLLGMSRREIQSKLDEIVDFAGVAKYIDTPVKRYSSGMQVRLGFSVAAFLEPEILIVDEVLAVGDAEFQKKAIGRMQDVSKTDGRTVLFVSHNMEAVKALCAQSILLENGAIALMGETNSVIENYLMKNQTNSWFKKWTFENAPGNDLAKFLKAELIPVRDDGKNIITVKSELHLNFEFWLAEDNTPTNLSLHLWAATGECIMNVITQLPVPILKKGRHSARCVIPSNLLNTGHFIVTIMIVKDTSIALFNLSDALAFEVEEEREPTNWHGKYPGFVRPKLEFIITNHMGF